MTPGGDGGNLGFILGTVNSGALTNITASLCILYDTRFVNDNYKAVFHWLATVTKQCFQNEVFPMHSAIIIYHNCRRMPHVLKLGGFPTSYLMMNNLKKQTSLERI